MVLCTTLKPNGKFSGLTKTEKDSNTLHVSGSVISVVWLFVLICTQLCSNTLNASKCLLKSHVSCLAIHIYFVLNSAQSLGKNKKNGNVALNNYLKESLLSLLCFIILRSRFFRKGFGLNCETKIYLIAVVFLVCTHAIKIEVIFAANSKYFVCFNKLYAGF